MHGNSSNTGHNPRMDTGEVDTKILEKLGYMAGIWLLIDIFYRLFYTNLGIYFIFILDFIK